MALNVRGKEFLLLVGNVAANPATYSQLEGQIDGNFDGSVNLADATAKDTSNWNISVGTTHSGRISVSGNVMGPAVSDRPNFELLKTAWLNVTTHGCKLVFDTAGHGYTGDFFVSMSITGAVGDVEKYSMDLTPAGALVAIVVP